VILIRPRVNSKATLRVPVAALLPYIPAVIHSAIRECNYYAKKSDDLVFQNDENRHQSLNTKACHNLLLELLKKLTEDRVPGEASEAQKAKVSDL
jgi:peptidyl-tRNA hydrolase ICT1